MASRLYPAFIVTGILVTLALFLTLPTRWQSAVTPWAERKYANPALTLDSKDQVSEDSRATHHSLKPEATSELGRAANETLGFEKVFVLGLKERTDRRDAMALQSALTGFHLDWVEGVKVADIPDKALPFGMDRKVWKGDYIGSWRGHMNAVRKIIEDNLSTALIMEDDMDWDIRLLSQMQDLAKGVRHLSNIPATKHQLSPYGDDWDLIWPGHCGEVMPEGDDRRYMIMNDETVAPKAHQPWLIGLKDLPESTRMVHKTGAPICTFAYALSARGARKVLAALGLKGSSLSFDNTLAFFCRDGVLDVKCFTVEPQLFNHHRSAGSMSKDSDLADTGSGIRDKGYTENIVWSTRLNVEKLITGATDYIMQW